MCFHSWKLFSKILLKEGDANDKRLDLYRSRHHIKQPVGPLKLNIEPLISPSIDFVTHLTIGGGCTFNISEMLCLTDMKNLGILELIQSTTEVNNSPPINDRIIRAWSEKDDPFPLLRVLRIWGDLITCQSLQWVSKFPSLALFDVIGLRKEWKPAPGLAKQYAWTFTAFPKALNKDTILRYLRLLGPAQDPGSDQDWESYVIDKYLHRLLAEPGCHVEHLEYDSTPLLLEHLYKEVNMKPQSEDFKCGLYETFPSSMLDPEACAFWLYSSIGQQNQNRDLQLKGVASHARPAIGGYVIPLKPMACVTLGHDARTGFDDQPFFERCTLDSMRQMVFTRQITEGTAKDVKPNPQPPKANVSTPSDLEPDRVPKRQKRKQMDALLQTFSE